MHLGRGAAILLPLLACAAGAQAPAFESAFPAATERVWVGPDFYANRLLDWRVKDGRLECLEGSAGKPMRTVHLLTCAIAPGDGSFETSVVVGPDELDPLDANTWAGFLFGVGGEHVDPRTSALCHHWPGEDGGLIAAVERYDRPVFRDNEHGDGPRGPGAEYTEAAWPPVPGSEPGYAYGPEWKTSAGEYRLTLRGEVSGETARLTLSVRKGGDRRLTELELELPAQEVVGGLALVSHGSPRGDGRGFWFRDWKVSGSKVSRHPERAFGPVMSTMYTLSDGVLKLTAQMGPLGEQDVRRATLVARIRGEWRVVARGTVREPSFTVPFRVQRWDGSVDTPYRVEYELRTGPDRTEHHSYPGTIRRVPSDRDELVLAALSCQDISSAGDKQWNNRSIWWPHAELVEHLGAHDPDMLFFAGDQIYEGGLAGIVRKPTERATLDYLYHWYRFVWAFRDLMRDRPTVCLPDDHDVYHGNIWGNGGVQAPPDERYRYASDRGGYMMDPAFVNTVHDTQVSHLPDPVDPAPLANGISVYFTRLEYAGLSFAIVADRMWKSAPAVLLPEGRVENGWFQNPDFDPVTQADVPGAQLLGPRQEAFLESWVEDWSRGAELKVMLSQTIFQNVATIPAAASSGAVLPRLEYAAPGEYVEGDRLAADCDSNGWPQSGRDRALRILRRGFGFHVAGDQHLPSFTQYGIDDWRDGPFAFCVPAIANLWPRRFFPPTPGANRREGDPRYAGDHLDGFGNRMTVLAVANPMRSGVEPVALNDRNPGYGIVRFDKRARTITSECWPRWVDPRAEDARQYPGWPITVSQLDDYRDPAADAWLPRVVVTGLERPVVQVRVAGTGELVYALRLPTASSELRKVRAGAYDVWVGDPDRDLWQVAEGITTRAADGPKDVRLPFDFPRTWRRR